MLLPLMTALLPLVAARPHQQHLLIAADPVPDLSAELFRSVHGLLKSWSQAFQPIGRTVVPAIIPTGTLLYHGRGDSHPPTSGIDWFALDAEHAYMFASRGFDSTFNTYVASRPLKVLYFDGFSASKGNPGSQDLQKLIALGIEETHDDDGTPDRSSPPRFEDGRISKGLCDWGAAHGIQGFVREEATFEVIWCDFGQGVRLLHSMNTTREDWDDHVGPPHPPEGAPPPFCTSRRPPPNRKSQPHAAQDNESARASNGVRQWQMLNAASWHYFHRDSRVHLSTGYLTTLTDAAYSSLWHIYQRPVQDRCLSSISQTDLALFRSQLETNIHNWHASTSIASEADYLGIVEVIVDRTAGRLGRVHAAFDVSNTTEATTRIKDEVLDILFPYLDVPRILWEGEHRPDARTRYAAIQQAAKACSTAYTSYTLDESQDASNSLIAEAIEGVLTRICGMASHILSDSLSMQVKNLSEGMRARYETKMLEIWRLKVESLTNWLDWPVWRTCEKACAADEICFMPMWPISMGDGPRGGPGGGPSGPGGHGDPDKAQPIQVPRCVKRGKSFV